MASLVVEGFHDNFITISMASQWVRMFLIYYVRKVESAELYQESYINVYIIILYYMKFEVESIENF